MVEDDGVLTDPEKFTFTYRLRDDTYELYDEQQILYPSLSLPPLPLSIPPSLSPPSLSEKAFTQPQSNGSSGSGLEEGES